MRTTAAPFSSDDPTGLYVHVPFCEGKCAYCGFYSEPIGRCDTDRVVSAIEAELERYRGTAVQTFYVGGGSPTCMGTKRLGRLLDAVAVLRSEPGEWTVECNPGQVDRAMLTMLRQRGVNRLSFGVQSFAAAELAVLGRRHGVKEAIRAVRLAQDVGFDNIGVDLIYAIPGSTLGSWEASLRAAMALGVQHVSAYALSIEGGTPLHKAISTGRVEPVDEETDRAMYEMAIDYLASAGFEQYEISNFARAGYACEHNLGYWENRPFIGVGPSAASHWRRQRTTNVADIGRYVEAIEAGATVCAEREPLEASRHICETAVLGLRMRQGIDRMAFAARTGADFGEVFGATAERYRRAGLMEVDAAGVRLSRQALPVADSVLCDFAAL